MRPSPLRPYTVELVHCCDCDHPDFAVTDGVGAAYGLPELFVWTVPDEGVDRDEHWELSERDQGAILDAAVGRALPVGLAVDSWERDLDGGRSVLRITVVPGDAELPVDPDVPVLRLHLTLVRPAIGTSRPWEPAAVDELHRRLATWADATGALLRTAGRSSARATAVTLLNDALEILPDDRTLRRHVGTAFRTAASAWLMLDLLDDELFRRATASVRATVSRAGIPDLPLPLPRQQQTKVRRDHFEAAWCLAWSGRGEALADLCVRAGAWKARDQRVWQVLAAAAVSDLRPDLLRLLPPGHRLAS